MKVLVPACAVLVLFTLVYVGVGLLGLTMVFGVVLPYLALLVFVIGFARRVIGWARVPVPFRIPTTCGQQRSLSWIRQDRLENPHTKAEVLGRMLLEVLLFRSLFRNTKAEVQPDGRLTQAPSKWLWIGSLAFHWCFLFVALRHLRFVLDPAPLWLGSLAALDGFLQIGLPTLLLTGAGLLAATLFLLARRLTSPQLRYASLPADYLPLFLVIGIVGSGLLLRHFVRTDVVAIKAHMVGLASFQPTLASGAHWLFFAHLTLICTLLMYTPFSKLMHMGGVFLSPTRNMANNSRAIRHVNPWNHPVPVHSYEDYEDEFRDKMKGAGIAVDKEAS